MEDYYYFCLMSLSITITYFKNNIAELKTPELSLGSDILIGSSGSHSSTTDLSSLKQNALAIKLSMSQISFCKILKQVIALFSNNYRPNLFLQSPKLSFFRLNLYETNS